MTKIKNLEAGHSAGTVCLSKTTFHKTELVLVAHPFFNFLLINWASVSSLC